MNKLRANLALQRTLRRIKNNPEGYDENTLKAVSSALEASQPIHLIAVRKRHAWSKLVDNVSKHLDENRILPINSDEDDDEPGIIAKILNWMWDHREEILKFVVQLFAVTVM